jgi:RNA polymerase sigma-70 factor (ECF subfamily)
MSDSRPKNVALHVVRGSEDRQFAARCVSGDPAALRELFQRECRRVHATLFRIIGSNAHIDDLLQDTFLQVFRSLHHFRGESSLRTWIDQCTVRVAYAYFRRKTRLVPVEAVTDIAAASPNAEERALHREAIRRLYAELDRLEPKQRLAFTLFTIDGRPLREIAVMMDASLVATKTRVWRARRTLEKRAKQDPILSEFVKELSVEREDTGTCRAN